MTKTKILLATTASVATLALPAFAEELAAEELTIESTDLSTVVGGTTFKFYGQINQGILSYDDGLQSNTYFPVDNDNSGSRIGLETETNLGSGWTMGTRLEFGITPSSTSDVNIQDEHGDWSFDKTDIRHLEVSFGSDAYGTFSFGQGSMATDGITGADFSGTGVIAGAAVSDMAGGQLVRDTLGGFTGGKVSDHFDNMDGSRRFRARYDSANYNGFVFSGSYGQEVLKDGDSNDYYDVAARYSKDFGAYAFDAGLGYAWNGDDEEVLSGSAAVLHKDTGLSLAVAAGRTSADHSSTYGYVKAGYQQDWFKAGTTAFSLDYYEGSDVFEQGAGSRSVGLAVVQNFDKQNLEVYGGIREYKFDNASADYKDGTAIMGGLRWKF